MAKTDKNTTDKNDKDEITGTETTGHEWDGIKELNTPLPRWWLWTFYATVVWGAAYTIAYPAWPLINEATGGLLGYSTRGALHDTLEARDAAQQPFVERIAALEMEEIAADAELARFARAGGAALFRNHCSQCHGSGAAGAPGYPNLLDDAWLWGGTPEEIRYTVAHGIRNEADPDARYSEMPAFGADGILSDEQIATVADYVLSLSTDTPATEEGRQIYAENCAACHGEDGSGNDDLGAPNLADAIWLYGGDRESVISSIADPQNGVMPPWGDRLTEAEVKQVALYVHGLGGGE